MVVRDLVVEFAGVNIAVERLSAHHLEVIELSRVCRRGDKLQQVARDCTKSVRRNDISRERIAGKSTGSIRTCGSGVINYDRLTIACDLREVAANHVRRGNTDQFVCGASPITKTVVNEMEKGF